MKRSHIVCVLAAVVLAGCSDARPLPSSPTFGGQPAAATTETIRGTVVLNPFQEILPMLDLRLDDGTFVGLTGTESQALASVIGADVEIVGTSATEAMVEVRSFLVLRVNGTDVNDGVLEINEDGYALRLTTGGIRMVNDPPAELILHVGERVWLDQPDDGPPRAFGVIHS
jgi:hypothetical protein